jgi:hypothetical protein
VTDPSERTAKARAIKIIQNSPPTHAYLIVSGDVRAGDYLIHVGCGDIYTAQALRTEFNVEALEDDLVRIEEVKFYPKYNCGDNCPELKAYWS